MAEERLTASAEPAPISANENYKLGEFACRYNLEAAEARRIMDEQGPSRTRLDAYMAARSAE
jgi:hypothetical protein